MICFREMEGQVCTCSEKFEGKIQQSILFPSIKQSIYEKVDIVTSRFLLTKLIV